MAARQDAAGFWEDWNLPVGASRMWTTAYVGWRLASSGYDAALPSLERAANWLSAAELDGGGWGYTESTGADADSTAFGILFLTSIGRRAPESAVRRLLRFSRDDGGFGTYGFEQSFGGWTASQVEVTATAALALRSAAASEETIRRAECFVSTRRRPDGIWDSYWWTSPFYATEACVRLLGENAREEAAAALGLSRPANAFDEALRAMVLRKNPAAAQLADGSWASTPVLRITRRDVLAPPVGEDAGPCFADPGRVFTTATVLTAMRGSRYSFYSSVPLNTTPATVK